MDLGEIVIDVDDVVAQFRRKFVDVANNVLGTDMRLEDCMDVYECEVAMQLTPAQNSRVWIEVNKKGFAADIEPMPGAVEAIEKLASRYDISFLTSPLKSSPTWVSDRRKWVRKHFGPTLADSIITTKTKFKVDADIFIDDRPEMIDAWWKHRVQRGGHLRMYHPIIFAWPYNAEYAEKAEVPSFHQWHEITEYLRCK